MEHINLQGQALDAVANRNCKVIVVGNPCNTNGKLRAFLTSAISYPLNPCDGRAIPVQAGIRIAILWNPVGACLCSSDSDAERALTAPAELPRPDEAGREPGQVSAGAEGAEVLHQRDQHVSLLLQSHRAVS